MNCKSFLDIFTSLSLLLLGCNAMGQENLRLTVQPGKVERKQALIRFRAPASLGGAILESSDGKRLSAQIDPEGDGALFIENLPPNEAVTFKFAPSKPDKSAIQTSRTGEKIAFRAGDKTLMEYTASLGKLPRENIRPAFLRGGYLHPITTLAGHVITDDYATNHLHHHGIWWSWTKTEFDGRSPDFWNMGDGKGKTDFVALSNHWSGPLHAGFISHHQYIDLTAKSPKVALHETWKVTTYLPLSNDYWIFDLECRQTCATDKPLKLPKYHYGGLGFRGLSAWNGKDKCLFLTSNGETDRVNGNTSRARWCDIYGNVGATKAGLAIMNHPANFRAPQPMRIHPDEPFFCYAPQQLGDMEIAPGQVYLSKYRVIIHDGPPDKGLLERLWTDYAEPVVADLKAER